MLNYYKRSFQFLSIIAVFIFVQTQSLSSMDLSISTRFSDAVLENLDIGESYNVTQMKGLPLTIINGSNVETDILVEVDVPKPNELKEGYESIPDPTWVRVLPSQFRLPAGGRNLSDILIAIPNDPKLVGRHFQVMFWAHTLQTGFLGVGVRVRIRFSIGASSPEALKDEMTRKRLLDLNFRLDPISVSAQDIPLGKKIDLEIKRAVVKLVNTGSTELKLRVVSSKYLNPQRPPSGYEEIPDPSWLKVKPSSFKSKPDTIIPLKITLEVPNLPEYKGKKFAGILNVSLEEEDIPVNIYSQILFTTEK